METIEGNKITTETLSGFSSSPHPPQTIINPTSEEMFGSDLGSDNDGGGATVVTTVVEKTEVTVKIVQENEHDILMDQEHGEAFEHSVQENEDDILMNQEAFEHSVSEKKEDNEAKEIDKEGVFADLFDGGVKVNSGENGRTLEGALAGDNVSQVMSYFEDEECFDAGFLADEHEETAGGEPMEVGLPDQKEEKLRKVTDVFEFNEETNPNGEGNRDNGEENAGGEPMEVCIPDQKGEKHRKITDVFEFNEDNTNEEGNLQDESEEEEEHDYVVGDFVWGKIKSHPWWPGQIYDPSDASDYAATMKRKGRLLVAYFGDGSFSWCLPSQLKPFVNHFQEMSNQSDSKKFVNAVKKSLEAVTTLVEAELTCKCQPINRVSNADVANSGIKPGVQIPRGNTVKVLIDRMSPIEFLSVLNLFALSEPGTWFLDLDLEFVMIKRWMSAYYMKKGGYVLPEYQDPKFIEGLEEESRNGNLSDYDINNGPLDGDDKSHQKRKQKSVAELLGDEPEIKKVKPAKKRKSLVALAVLVSPESDESRGGGGMEEETETETGMLTSPRERKKSKYLSPPYLSPTAWTGKLSGSGSGSFKEPKPGSGSFKEPKEPKPEPEKEKVPEVLEESSGSSRRKPRQKRRSMREGSDEQDLNVNVSKMLHGLLRVALDPSSSAEKKNLPGVTGFISSFRSSVFEDGSDPKKMKREWDGSDLGFVKWKVEEMMEMVNKCEGDEMSADLKARLEGGMNEVLEKVGKIRG